MTTRTRLVFRLVVPTGVAKTTSTLYVSTRGFRTASADTPASTYIEERVAKAGGFSRSLYSGGSLGGLIKPNYGVLVLNNEDGGLDTIASYAGGGGTVTCWWGEEGAAFPAGYTQVYAATIASVLVDLNTVTIRQQDRFEQLNRPIVTATFAGSGGLEGTDNGARKKQLVFGRPGMIPLTLVDKVNQVYYIQAGATDLETVRGLSEFGVVFEGGVPIDRAANYPFKEWLFTTADVPDPGDYRMWTGYQGLVTGSINFGSQAAADAYTRGPLYVRLGGVPVGELRFGAYGLLQNSTRTAAREWRFSDLCNRAGLNDVSSSSMAVMQNGMEDFTAGNRLVEGDQTYAQVMADRCQALLGACGFNRLDEFFCVTLTDPEDGADSSVYTFTADNSTGFARLPVPGLERPIWQVNVKAGRSFPCTVFSGASAEMQDLLTREGYYVNFRGFSSSARRRYPNALSVDLEIDGHDFPTAAQQREFVDRFGALFGTRRDLMSLRCLDFSAATLTLELHDKVTLTLDRLGYDAGELMRIVGIELDLDAQQIKFSLWGTNSGFNSWSLTGGAFPADAGEPGGSWGSEDPPPELVEQTTVTLGLNEQMGEFTGLLVGGPIVIPVPVDAMSNAAAMGDFTGAIVGEIASGLADVMLLVQGGTNGATSITDLTSYGDTVAINNYASFSSAQQVFGNNMILTTSIGAAIDPFSSIGAASRFGRATGDVFTIDCWVNIVSPQAFAPSSYFWAWAGTAGSIFEIGTHGSTPKLRIRNGSDASIETATITTGEHFIQVNFDGASYTVDVDGVEVYAGTNSYLIDSTGTFYFQVASNSATGSATGPSTEIYVTPLRFTKGELRARGSVPTGAFATS